MHTTSHCLVIPAVKKNAVIPDQLVKRLAGTTLIQRAVNTAKQVVSPQHIIIVTDSDEIRLIGERNHLRVIYEPSLTIASLDIVASLSAILRKIAVSYSHIIIYRASSPLITAEDIIDAYQKFMQSTCDCLVTVKSIQYRLWREHGHTIDALLFNDEGEKAYIETKALFMIRSAILSSDMSTQAPHKLTVIPYFLNDRSVEINSYQDWWICEKLLESKHIIFVVAGYSAIGMGHIYRALMLAHEITDHRITFLCTKESELAVEKIAEKDYQTKRQISKNLAEDVLALRPDLVVNDILNTNEEYVMALKNRKIAVVNFEDEGQGARKADLVINALYEQKDATARQYLYGHGFFCLRDEFVFAKQNPFRKKAKRLLITFGGTDSSDYTKKTLDALYKLALQNSLEIVIVTGPGYEHAKSLHEHILCLSQSSFTPVIEFTHSTNVMSQKMEGVDIAVSSAGRTVYELAHMRIPAIIIPHHEREDMHTFARPENGFMYLGIMRNFQAEKLQKAFTELLCQDMRKEYYNRLSRFDFTQNKPRVIHAITSLLKKEAS